MESSRSPRVARPGRGRRRLVGVGLSLALLLLADLVAGWTLFADGTWRRLRLAPYDPPRFSPAQDVEFERVVARLADPTAARAWMPFDRELGWAPRPDTRFGQYAYDGTAARVGNPEGRRAPADGAYRVLTFGCSFTHGDEVEGPEAWPAVLERSTDGLRVVNYGVGAYGLDQALLRMRRTAARHDPHEVWFGLLPAAALRATTCYRPLIRPWSNALAFKPRFDVGGADELELIPVDNPARGLEDVALLASDAEAFLTLMAPIDPWVAACEDAFAPRGSRLLHHLTVGRLWLTWRVRKAPRPGDALRGPGARAFAIQRAIAWNARREAEALGARFRYLILPGKPDLEALEAEGSAPWAPFTRELRELGIEVIDTSEAIRSMGPEAFVEGRGGHYSPAGNECVARFLLEHLED